MSERSCNQSHDSLAKLSARYRVVVLSDQLLGHLVLGNLIQAGWNDVLLVKPPLDFREGAMQLEDLSDHLTLPPQPIFELLNMRRLRRQFEYLKTMYPSAMREEVWAIKGAESLSMTTPSGWLWKSWLRMVAKPEQDVWRRKFISSAIVEQAVDQLSQDHDIAKKICATVDSITPGRDGWTIKLSQPFETACRERFVSCLYLINLSGAKGIEFLRRQGFDCDAEVERVSIMEATSIKSEIPSQLIFCSAPLQSRILVHNHPEEVLVQLWNNSDHSLSEGKVMLDRANEILNEQGFRAERWCRRVFLKCRRVAGNGVDLGGGGWAHEFLDSGRGRLISAYSYHPAFCLELAAGLVRRILGDFGDEYRAVGSLTKVQTSRYQNL